MLASMIFIYTRAKTFDLTESSTSLLVDNWSFRTPNRRCCSLDSSPLSPLRAPMFPFHTWLPDFHEQAPGTRVWPLLLKMGVFGLIRFCVPLFPAARRQMRPWIIVLAIIGIIYGALLALAETNILRLIAYSSVSHVGFMVLGIFTFTQFGTGWRGLPDGQSRHHHGRLFLLVGLLMRAPEIDRHCGFRRRGPSAPWLSTVFLITTLAGHRPANPE